MNPDTVYTVIAYNDENRLAIARDPSGQVGILNSEDGEFGAISEGQAKGAVLKYNFVSITPTSVPFSQVKAFVASLP